MDGDNHFHHDHLGWEYCSSVQAITTPPILWTSNSNKVHHQQHVIDESFLVMSSTKKPSHNNINNNNNNSVVSADIMSSNPSFSCPNSVDDNPFACFAADNSNVATSCSLESLECLLSATNSNTDEDVDDGISLIFSECRNLLNNTNTAKNNVSSGEPSQSPNPNPNPNNNTNSNNNKRSLGLRMVLSESKKPKKNHNQPTTTTTNINFSTSTASPSSSSEPDPEAVAQMKEMIYRAAAFRPVNMGFETVERPRRKNVRISTDPQTVAARQRRERISERIRVLQRLVPGGTKMDTASMLDEAASYLKFLRFQVKALEGLGHKIDSMNCPSTNFAFSFNPSFPMQTTNNNTTTVLPQVVLQNPNHHNHHIVSHYQS